MKTFTKDPNADLDYTFDWSTWLGTDTIATSSWFVDDSGLVVGASVNTGTTTTAWFSGGAVGTRYRITNRITTTSNPPRIDDRSAFIRVRER